METKEKRHQNKTWFPTLQEERHWWVINAEGKTLGRLSSQVAKILRGKHKPSFTPFKDTGDFVVIINCEKIHLSGKKKEKKKYYSHSRFVGSLKESTAKQLLEKKPEKIIESSIKGMLPRNKLSRKQLKKLKIYPGANHPHHAQKPSLLELKTKIRKG